MPDVTTLTTDELLAERVALAQAMAGEGPLTIRLGGPARTLPAKPGYHENEERHRAVHNELILRRVYV